MFRLVFNLPHAIVILHSGNKVIRSPAFNATLTSVSSISASRACNVFPSEEITAVLNVYWLIVSTPLFPRILGAVGGILLWQQLLKCIHCLRNTNKLFEWCLINFMLIMPLSFSISTTVMHASNQCNHLHFDIWGLKG